ncbi:MAG: sulfur oxidation c-type cytochrome SoxA [Gammaproteobacteria bacterium]
MSLRFKRLKAGWLPGLLLFVVGYSGGVYADPAQDLAEFRAVYAAKFPTLALEDFVLGTYAIDPELRAQWIELNEFPPYEFAIDEGRALFEAPFANGRTLADCLPDRGVGFARRLPLVEPNGRVLTLPSLINRCRRANGASPWESDRGPLVAVMTYLATLSRGQPLHIPLPATVATRQVYEEGRRLFYAKRGQRNLSCADCHVAGAGRRLREQTLAPLLGAVNHYPVYNLQWGAMGTLHGRFAGCFEQVNAAAPQSQSRVYRALEYFLAVMSDGLPFIGPGLHR